MPAWRDAVVMGLAEYAVPYNIDSLNGLDYIHGFQLHCLHHVRLVLCSSCLWLVLLE